MVERFERERKEKFFACLFPISTFLFLFFHLAPPLRPRARTFRPPARAPNSGSHEPELDRFHLPRGAAAGPFFG